MSQQKAVISVKQESCVNCHRCISVCPVKFCNDGSGDYVEIDSDLCIGCGLCLTACQHNARVGVDDFSAFMHDLKARKKIVAIVAPSAAAVLKGMEGELNGWLRKSGVVAVFDVSFGAELTTKSYYEYLKKIPKDRSSLSRVRLLFPISNCIFPSCCLIFRRQTAPWRIPFI